MGLLTRKQVEEIRQGKVEGVEAPTLPPTPQSPTFRVRMHHPDTTVSFPLRDFEMEIGSEKVEVKAGVAVVYPEQAAYLKELGWLTGRKLPLEGEEDESNTRKREGRYRRSF